MGVLRLDVAISSPMQQTAAVLATRDFLLRLTQPSETPRVPRDVRGEARALLRHYPLRERLLPILEDGLGVSQEQRRSG